MGLQKGMTNNRNGRPKGKPNKNTEELRALFQSFIEVNIETLQDDFDKLEAKDRLAFIEKMARLVMPAPMNELQRLTDEQLDSLIKRLKNENND
jgi:hypothetical protein